jgi:hypothetical protein
MTNEEIASLISSADWWEVAGYVATAIVGIGVIGESVADFTTWLKPRALRRKVEKTSALVLIVGIALEIFTQAESNKANSLAVAALNDRAAKAELALAKMNAARIITAENTNALVAKLRQHTGKKFWIITQKASDSNFGEQINLSRQLTGAFLAAGWVQDRHSTVDKTQLEPEFTAPNDRGCLVDFAHDASSVALGHSVWTALSEAEVECTQNPSDGLVSDFIEIEIGIR